MSAMITAAVIGVGGSLVAANQAKQAAKGAAAAQTNAANQANQTQWDMYNQNRADQAPWRNAGGWAVGQLRDMLGNGSFHNFGSADFQTDPGYQFRLQQGQQALERSAAARGGALGGGTLKALTRYNSGMASDEYGRAFDRFNVNQANTFNRLSSLAGLGQTSANQVGQYGMNAANQIGANQIGIGNAQAAGQMAQANAWNQGFGGATNALTGGLNNWMFYKQLNGQQGNSGWNNFAGGIGPNSWGATNNPYGYGG